MSQRSERWRMFCAVELPQAVRERAASHIARLREVMPEVRAGWDSAEKMHITLKFLGDTAISLVPALTEATERATQATRVFTLGIEGADAFPERGMPRVLWLGVKDETEALARLQHSLEDACASVGFKREERSFHPHLTIARVRTPQGARKLAALHRELEFPLMEFPVSELVVIRSELGPGGSRYTTISRHAFKNGF